MSQITTNSTLVNLTRPYAEMVEQKLKDYLSKLNGPSKLVEAMSYAGLGPGKRLRPVLVLMSNEACNGESGPALAAGCAIEMIHAYSLVHDDLPSMDDDNLRRGRPTCHKVYGEAMAILTGDALLTEAFGIMAKEIESAELLKSLINELAEAGGASGMVGGQAADITAEQDGGDAEMLDYIHSHKTGKLIRACCRIGALTAGASKEELQALSDYGEAVGMAFQIIDDLLDLNSSAEVVGKNVGKDNRAGKLTYPSLLGSEAARQKVRSLSEQAEAALEPLGKRGKKLLSLAQMLAERAA